MVTNTRQDCIRCQESSEACSRKESLGGLPLPVRLALLSEGNQQKLLDYICYLVARQQEEPSYHL